VRAPVPAAFAVALQPVSETMPLVTTVLQPTGRRCALAVNRAGDADAAAVTARRLRAVMSARVGIVGSVSHTPRRLRRRYEG